MSILKKIAGTAGMLAAVVAPTAIVVAVLRSPWFSWTGNALSDLGGRGRPMAPVFNLGLIIGGILAVTFALGLFIRLAGTLARVGAFVLVLGSIALAGVGVFHIPHPLHGVVAGAFFILIPISLFLLWIGLPLPTKPILRWGTLMAWAVTLLSALVLVMLLLTGFADIAIPEFTFALATTTWMFAFGLGLVVCFVGS